MSYSAPATSPWRARISCILRLQQRQSVFAATFVATSVKSAFQPKFGCLRSLLWFSVSFCMFSFAHSLMMMIVHADVVQLEDVALYGGLCALACFSRSELRSKVIDCKSFQLVLELHPRVRFVVVPFGFLGQRTRLSFLLKQQRQKGCYSTKAVCLRVRSKEWRSRARDRPGGLASPAFPRWRQRQLFSRMLLS
jgi:hypothetical protein